MADGNVPAVGAFFAESVGVMLDAGATLDDALLEAMLLDDDARLRELLQQEPQNRAKKFQLECAYAPLHGVLPLHVCAEYNGVKYGRALVRRGGFGVAAAGAGVGKRI
jgi:hypothetical protein